MQINHTKPIVMNHIEWCGTVLRMWNHLSQVVLVGNQSFGSKRKRAMLSTAQRNAEQVFYMIDKNNMSGQNPLHTLKHKIYIKNPTLLTLSVKSEIKA